MPPLFVAQLCILDLRSASLSIFIHVCLAQNVSMPCQRVRETSETHVSSSHTLSTHNTVLVTLHGLLVLVLRRILTLGWCGGLGVVPRYAALVHLPFEVAQFQLTFEAAFEWSSVRAPRFRR